MLGAILASAATGHAADVPRKAGDITITLLNGRKVKPQDFAGKVLSLSFILTT
jgi:hypothetical protein